MSEPQEDIKEITCIFDCSEQNVQKCRKCGRPFCIMHANRFSPNFCKECFSNLAVIEGKFHRTFSEEVYVEETDSVKTVVTNESCKKYYIDGPDWPFLTTWIDTLSDDELRVVWNFHFFVMKTIEAENETRKVERQRKLREEGDKLPKLVTSKTTISKTTQSKPVDTPDTIRAKLKKQGLPDIVIEQMVKVMTGS